MNRGGGMNGDRCEAEFFQDRPLRPVDMLHTDYRDECFRNDEQTVLNFNFMFIDPVAPDLIANTGEEPDRDHKDEDDKDDKNRN